MEAHSDQTESLDRFDALLERLASLDPVKAEMLKKIQGQLNQLGLPLDRVSAILSEGARSALNRLENPNSVLQRWQNFRESAGQLIRHERNARGAWEHTALITLGGLRCAATITKSLVASSAMTLRAMQQDQQKDWSSRLSALALGAGRFAGESVGATMVHLGQPGIHAMGGILSSVDDFIKRHKDRVYIGHPLAQALSGILGSIGAFIQKHSSVERHELATA